MGLQSIELLTVDDFPVLKKHGLICAMVSGVPGGIQDGWNRLEHHDKIVKFFEETIPIVANAGYLNIICFSGNRGGMDDEKGLENCAIGLKRVVGLAEKHKVNVVMELLNSKVNHKDYMCDHTNWGVALCKRVGSERFKLLYDIYHMQIMEGDVIRTIQGDKGAGIEAAAPYIAQFQVDRCAARSVVVVGDLAAGPDVQSQRHGCFSWRQEFKGIDGPPPRSGRGPSHGASRADVLASLRQGVQICDV